VVVWYICMYVQWYDDAFEIPLEENEMNCLLLSSVCVGVVVVLQRN
jgi:hypothetical protein